MSEEEKKKVVRDAVRGLDIKSSIRAGDPYTRLDWVKVVINPPPPKQ